MGNIIQKFPAHLIDPDLTFDILLKLVIGGFQLGDRLFQLFRHTVKILSQHVDLVSGMTFIFRVKIKIAHFSGKQSQFADRFCNSLGYDPECQTAYENNRNSHIQIKTVGYRHALTNTFQRGTDKKIIFIADGTPALHIIHIGKTIAYLLNDIGICLLQSLLPAFVLIQLINITNQAVFQHSIIAPHRRYGLSVPGNDRPGKIFLRTFFVNFICNVC